MSDDTTTTDDPATEDAPVERDEQREELLASFTEALGDAVLESHILPGKDLWIRVATEAWEPVADVARNRLRARYFCFLSAIDWMPSPFGRAMDSEVDRQLAGDDGPAEPAPIETGSAGGETRFQVFARLAHVGDPGRTWGVTLKADVPDEPFAVQTWTRHYAGADWHERETWEMYGIGFTGHPGLRNLYLPTDFEGHPLRKDFPLLSRHVKPWPGIVDVEQFPDDGSGGDEPTGDEPTGDEPTGDDGEGSDS